MIFFGQRNPLWAGVKLGSTNRTIAQVGCTTCCMSDAASYFGMFRDPAYLAKTLKYTSDALIIWQSLPIVGLSLVKRFYQTEPLTTITEALKNPGKVVALNVDRGGHWVFAIRYLGFGRYWVHDPWTGTKKIYSGVVGGAIISKV